MSIEEKIFMARVAEQSERFADMVDFIKPVVKEKGDSLNKDEQNLLSVAFKNLISSKRTAIRTVTAIESNPKYTKYATALEEYKKAIQEQLYCDCDYIIGIIKADIAPKATEAAAKAFFQKMIGDYYRYIAESASGGRLEDAKQGAINAYEGAQAPVAELQACNSIRLGFFLNFSVFYYEVIQDVKKAVELAEKALAEALDKLDDCDEEMFRDA